MVQNCPLCGLAFSGKPDEHETAHPRCTAYLGSFRDGCIFISISGETTIACRTTGAVHALEQDQMPPEDGVILPLKTENLSQDETGSWALFSLPPDTLPLAAQLLLRRNNSGELLWSWFKLLVRDLQFFHARNLAHGRIEPGLMFVSRPMGPDAATESSRNPNRLYVAGLFTGPAPKSLLCRDLQDLGSLFHQLLSESPEQKGLQEFRQLCLDCTSGAILDFNELSERIEPAVRMGHLTQDRPVVAHKSLPWKKTVLLFGTMFTLSLIAAWVFRSKPAPRETEPPPQLLPAPPVSEPVVEKSTLKWNMDFPLHRVPVQEHLTFFLHPEHGIDPDFLQEVFDALGFPLPAVARNPDVAYFGNFLLTGKNWKPSTRLALRSRREETGNSFGPWLPLLGAQNMIRPDAVSPPPMLLGEIGNLFTMLHYSPENTDAERMLLFFQPPLEMAPPQTVWHWLLGGIRPTFMVARLRAGQSAISCILSYEQPHDAKAAHAFLERSLHTLVGRHTRMLELDGRHLRVQIPMAVIQAHLAARRPVPPEPEPASRDIPAPPVVITEPEFPDPEPIPVEHLNIPEF